MAVFYGDWGNPNKHFANFPAGAFAIIVSVLTLALLANIL